MENEIERYLLGEPLEASQAIASEINKSNAKFINFIEGLETGLTSTDNVTRGRATHMIGDVVEMLPPSFLSKDQGDMVTKFLLAKLRDHHSVQPHALQSLAVLTSRCSSLGDETVKDICHTIFREVQNQTLSHADRGATYRILQNLLGTSTQALRDLGGDFVIGFIQQMDAEKDPRNLLVCFNCAQFICSNFSLGAFAEEMFEILGCYFPVDFVPPPNNPHGITKEELVTALRKCFSATPQFAEFSLPLLLEKMTSDLQSARLDSFITLVLMNISSDLVESAKNAIIAVYKAIVSGTKNNHSATENIVELYQDIVKFLDGPDLKKSCLAFSLCCAMADSSSHAMAVMIPLVLPTLISRCHKHNQVPEQFAFVKELNGFLYVIHKNKENTDALAPFQNLMIPAFTLFEKILECTSTDLQLEAVKGLSLISTSGLADNSQVQSFLDILVSKSLAVPISDLRTEVLCSLRAILEANPKLSEQTIRSLAQQSNQGEKKLSDTDNINMATDALVHTVVNSQSFTEVNKFFLQTMSQGGSEKSEQIVSCAKAMEQLVHQISKTDMFSQVHTSIALPLVRLSIQASKQWTEESRKICEVLMNNFRNVFSALGEFMDKSHVTSLWDKISLLFLEGDTQDLDLSGSLKKIQPLLSDSPWQQTCLIALVEGFVTSVDIQALEERRDQFFEATYVLALHTQDEFTHLSACRCVAVIMNKAPIGSQIQWFLEPMIEKLKMAMTLENPLQNRLQAVRLWLWLTKAMECRGHSATGILSSHLVSLLSDPDLGSEVGRNLSMVVEDMDDIFSKRHHSIVTPLYKQRFFSLNLKTLVSGYNSAVSIEVKQNHLLAVSGVVSKLPLQVTKPHLTLLIPLLMLSLKDKENPSLVAILSSLKMAGASAPETVTSNIDSLVPQLLDLSINTVHMKVRIAALECLEQLTGLPSHVLVPHQKQVVHELKQALDDKKRLVRRQAAETRSAWILLQPEKTA
ncbi:MMS19 nucleotide excision repair protein homolog [Elysia marginata]|uniref:MMS19 nucleotide excision repair protein n=1 Tax=Elysia marginata TaxID=1093978 RepID=A0AAV4JQF8_9GAST|nr:MMS19 nucleotide excision repair protein homolog [Elysia marginata]